MRQFKQLSEDQFGTNSITVGELKELLKNTNCTDDDVISLGTDKNAYVCLRPISQDATRYVPIMEIKELI